MRTMFGPWAALALGALVCLLARGDDCAPVLAELEAAQRRVASLEAENAKLRTALNAALDARLEREREWLRYTEGMAQLEKLSSPERPRFESSQAIPTAKAADSSVAAPASTALAGPSVSSPAVSPSTQPASSSASSLAGTAAPTTSSKPSASAADLAAAVPSASDASIAHSHALLLALRSLFAIEQVTGFDLLEVGNVQVGFTGPVVLRVLDARGRPLGSISADRLRLESSRAARTVTIVLESGYERRSGLKTPFEGSPPDADGRAGVRRIVLPNTEPKPWLDAVPELFREEDRAPILDDGLHDLRQLRAALNLLLHAEAASGEYRVVGISGVQGSVMRDVALDALDAEGRIERRLFADRLSVLRETQGVQILLEGGSQVRGDQKTPFLEGRYRIFLPRASADAWKKAGIPGLIDIGAPKKD